MKKLILLIFILALCSASIAQQQYTFPLKHSNDERYLVDQNNKPFPILGRTAWFVISQPVNKYKKFIQNTLSYSYNSIEISVLTHDMRGEHPPFCGNGEAPFLKTLGGDDWKGSLRYKDTARQAPDMTTPNEAFWKYVDSFL